ncbi:TPR-containing protein DDB_G0280363-like [Adelges cooleyi]|uniref:TPR-containing protein DDB_G0280363-like n=1 Tax=Adelges cooleyi TaxID=133065 RepID=UPI00217F28E5|nr:TPR-containing protein DDB_G0280363-like [Adelges cooleyi]
MKASLVFASALLACVALSAATTRVDGKNSRLNRRDQDSAELNRDANIDGIEHIYDDDFNTNDNLNLNRNNNKYYNRHDCTKLKNMHKPQCKHFKNNNNQLIDDHDENNKNNNDNYNNNNNDWYQYGRSSEESMSGEESNERFQQNNLFTVSGTNSLSKAVTDKIAALSTIIATGTTDDNNMRDPLTLKTTTVKSSKKHFVNIHDAQLRNLNNGKLQYFAVNPESDNIYVEYDFNNLNANGQYKTNLENIKSGQFNIDLKNVRSNVTARFHSHRATLMPAKFEYADVTVYDENNQETTNLNEAFENKYINVLKHAISAEVYSTAHKGVFSQIKKEINTPLTQQLSGNLGKLFDMRWKEGNVAMEINNVGNQLSSNYNNNNDMKVRSMSYTRLDAGNYKLRFDVKLGGLQWNSDVVATVDGQRAQAQNVNFNLKKVEIEVKVIKSANNDQCRRIKTDVYLHGLQYQGLNRQMPSTMNQMIDQNMSRFIQHSLEAYMQKTIQQVVCEHQKW